jgi:hypothetical protein
LSLSIISLSVTATSFPCGKVVILPDSESALSEAVRQFGGMGIMQTRQALWKNDESAFAGFTNIYIFGCKHWKQEINFVFKSLLEMLITSCYSVVAAYLFFWIVSWNSGKKRIIMEMKLI